MARRLPPFAAVRAFEAAARHNSFTKAAGELCVTPSAVSHQIRALEDYLATSLFHRDGNCLRLTRTGQAYVGKLTGLLDGLESSTRQVARADPRDLSVLTTPGFAARWLVPRLGRFANANRLRLRLSAGAPSCDFATNDADVVLQWAHTPTPGVVVEPLMTTGRHPVISPALLSRERIETPSDLLRMTLFYDEVMDGWAEWFQAAGIETPVLPPGPRFPHCELSTTAAEQEQGVALAYHAIVSDTLAGGSLVRLFDTVTSPVLIYSVAYPEARADDPAIRGFRDWLFDEYAAQERVLRNGDMAAE